MKINRSIIENTSRIKIQILVFAFFLFLNLLTTGGHIFSIDDVQYFLHTENLALNHSIMLDPNTPSATKLTTVESLKQIQHKFYSYHGREINEDTPLIPFYDAASLLLPFAAVPMYYVSTILSADPTIILPFFTNSIVISLVALMIFITSRHLFKSERISFIISLTYIVTTFVWPYNTGMMLRPFASLLLLLGFYYIITTNKENYYRSFVAGICVSLSMLAEVSAIILLPGALLFGLLYLRKYKKNVLLFLIGFILIVGIQIILNEIRFGSATDFGFGFQQDITTHSHTDGIIGYIFSLGWGIIFNSPLLLFFPPSIYFAWKTNKVLGLFLSYCFIITWLFHGTEVSPLWSGYGGWGPRYFNIILPLLMISIGFFFREFSAKKLFKIGFIVLSGFGFFVNLMGKLIWYMYGYDYGWGVLRTHLLPNSWEHLNYDFNYAPITLHLLALSTGYVQDLAGSPGWGLAPCKYDLFILCKFGIYPFIISLAFLAFIAYLIIKRLQVKNVEINMPEQ